MDIATKMPITDEIPAFAEVLPRVPLSAVAVYETETDRERVDDVHRRLVETLGVHFEFAATQFRLDDLQDEQLIAAAAAAASKADLVFVAIADAPQPPPLMRAWTEKWVDSRTVKDALLAVIPWDNASSERSETPMCAYLQSVARSSGMDFLSQAITSTANVSASPEVTPGPETEVPKSVALVPL